MIKRLLMKSAQAVLIPLGLELRRRDSSASDTRATLEGALAQVKLAGLAPKTIIDVGAAYGATVHALGQAFPDARIVAVEALRAYASSLEPIVAQQTRGQIVWAAAGREDGTVAFNVHHDLVGSSLYKEVEGEIVNGTEQTVPMIALDTLAAREELNGPYLLKIDVQGAELDVLRGAASVLAQTEYLTLEVSLFKTLIGGPQIADVFAFLHERGFVCYDVLDGLYRPIDGALCQLDMCFVKDDSPLRADHRYARPEQRLAQDAAMLRAIESLKRS